MPLLRIETNIELDEAAKQKLLKEGSVLLANMLNKSPRYVMLSILDGISLYFADSAEPACYAELKSINLPLDRTTEFSKLLCDFLAAKLGVPQERIYIEFSSAPRTQWGWSGRTF